MAPRCRCGGRQVRDKLRLPVQLGGLRAPHREDGQVAAHRHRLHLLHAQQQQQGGRPGGRAEGGQAGDQPPAAGDGREQGVELGRFRQR